jgi:hypothetical protein
VTAAVVPDRGRDAARLGDQLLDRFSFVGSTRDGLVQVVHIGLVVLAMVDLHRERIDMGFQCVMGIREGR